MKCEHCGEDYSGEVCPFCENESDGQPENGAELPVLTSEKHKKRKNIKMGKTIIIIVIILLAIAVTVTVAAVRGRRNDKNRETPGVHTEQSGDGSQEADATDTSPVTFSEDVSLSFEGISLDYADALDDYTAQSAETTTFKPESTAAFTQTTTKKNQITTEKHLETTTVKTQEPAKSSNNAIKVIAAFFDGTYYFDGEMITDDGKIPLEMAMDGADYQIFTEMDGADICIMNSGGKIYLMDPAAKKYTELNAAVKKMLGITDDMFSFGFTKVKFDASSPTSVTKATYKNEDAVCYSYANSSKKLEFIAVNDKIKQMALYDTNEKSEAVLEADEFTAEIPSEMFNFKGYSKTNLISFMSSLM